LTSSSKPSNDGNFTNDTSTLNASAGAIYVYEYNTAGDRTGKRVKKGRTGTAYYFAATDHVGGTNELRSHLMAAEPTPFGMPIQRRYPLRPMAIRPSG
jgi:hypothetical protein